MVVASERSAVGLVGQSGDWHAGAAVVGSGNEGERWSRRRRSSTERFVTPPTDYYGHDRPEVCDLVSGTGLRVLELGCAAGSLGAELRRRGVAGLLHGVEVSPRAAAKARETFDQVWVRDLEDLESLQLDPPYDVLVAADVLEHLRDPWRVLSHAVDLLVPHGLVVASIPNVRYWRVVTDLVARGQFRYVSEGVLDQTHLRFFTRASIVDLMSGAGLHTEQIARRQPHGRSRLKRVLEALVGDFANPAFLIRATKESISGPLQQPDVE